MAKNYLAVDTSSPDYPLVKGTFFNKFDCFSEFVKAVESIAPNMLNYKIISERIGQEPRREVLLECSFKQSDFSTSPFFVYVCPLEGGGRFEGEQRIQFNPSNRWEPTLHSLEKAHKFLASNDKTGLETYVLGIYKTSENDDNIVFSGLYPSSIDTTETDNNKNSTSSVQIRIDSIQRAYQTGVDMENTSTGVPIINFTPKNLFWYMINRDNLHVSDLKKVADLVKAHKTTPCPIPKIDESESLQTIYYGAPGTGKSRRIKEFLKKRNVPKTNIFRTTFHPDSDYSSFVGSYKPSKGTKMMYGLNGGSTVQMEFNGEALEEEVITYRYIPQVFLLAYIQAFKNPDENVYLVIEEINRGNCAQIFGDLFQLLDRDEYGKSEYPIKADTDLKKFLEDELGKDNEGIADGELCLPSNFRIYATMNTSDQSLFPIDSAFKRRWDWEYEPIKYKNTTWMIDIDGVKYSWVKFQKEVNNRILKDTGSEDKMMGDYFVNPNTGVISKNLFLNKILFYLWNDVCKDGDTDIFPTNNDFSFSSLYADDSSQTLHSLMENLNVQPEPDSPSEGDEEDNLPDSNNGNSNKIPRYSIDGSTERYSTPNAVHKVIEDYALQNEATSVDDMIKLWNEISGRSNYAVAEWEPSPNDNQPFAGKRRSEIKWGNGKSIWIINGWTKDLFKIFISNVKDRFGIDIEEVE